jgi:hypothetical protein
LCVTNNLQLISLVVLFCCIPWFLTVNKVPDTQAATPPRKREELLSSDGQWRSFPKGPHLLQYVSNGNYYGRINHPPHHHTFVALVLEQVVNAPDVADGYAPDTDAGGQFPRWPGAQPIGFIAANIEPRKGQPGANLRIEVSQESVGFFLDPGEHIGGFAQGRVFGMLQDLSEVPERLLVAEN